ncbi:unnamed protein product [Staurois parvus]|uniref:Uncharacterized protein n=1 Tax=Staurois parvus TaxID=386267 RepID=A0ABN9HEY9_9NEOB|nr:unnamed protein product [Staurois parvus]
MGPRTASSCCCQARICHGPPYRLLMLLPGPECLMGPCTASHCCCLHRHTLPCATFRSPHTAGGFHFVIGCIGCQADYGPPIAAAARSRPVRPSHCCHVMGPRTASSCCCQVQSLSWVPVRPPIAAVSIATLCHVPLSGLLTLLVGSILS